MITHEIILSCSSLQGVGTCIPLCQVLGFATFPPGAKASCCLPVLANEPLGVYHGTQPCR